MMVEYHQENQKPVTQGGNEMIHRFERFSFAIAEINRCWHKITTDEMEEYGLKGSYSVYFTTLYRYPQGLTAVQLGELCGRDKADVSRTVAVLAKKQLIRRAADGAKVYRAPLMLTQEGRALAERINEKAMTAGDYASQGRSEEKRAVFHEALELITTNLQNMSKEGLPQK